MMDLPVTGEQLAGWQAGPGIAACLAVQVLRPAAGQVVPPCSAARLTATRAGPQDGHMTDHRIRGWPGCKRWWGGRAWLTLVQVPSALCRLWCGGMRTCGGAARP